MQKSAEARRVYQRRGMVGFTAVAADRTRINLKVLYDPKSFIEAIGDTVGVVSSRLENDLKSFKEFIENRGYETGAWRGTIRE